MERQPRYHARPATAPSQGGSPHLPGLSRSSAGDSRNGDSRRAGHRRGGSHGRRLGRLEKSRKKFRPAIRADLGSAVENPAYGGKLVLGPRKNAEGLYRQPKPRRRNGPAPA